MRTARSGVLAFRLDPVLDGISGVLLDRFLHALTARAEERGYRVMLYTAASDLAELRQFSTLTQACAVDAFVLVGTHQDDSRYARLAEQGIPFSVFGRPWPSAHAPRNAAEPTHAWIDVDAAAGTAQATRHLIGLGHRRIAFVGWPEGSGTGDERRRGWEEALAGVGVAAGATAFVCASDSLAVGAFGALQAAGAQAAVVGFDDSPTAAALGLSSVRQPLEEAASWALTSVLAQLDGRSRGPGDSTLLLPELAVRASSVPPRVAEE